MDGTDIKKFEGKVLDGVYSKSSGELRGFKWEVIWSQWKFKKIA